MPNRPNQIPLSAATTGMTLSDPVLDTKGNVLLPQGTVLTTALVQSLARHQIDSIAITAEAPSQAEMDVQRDRQIARVERLFRMTGSAGAGPATEILHRLVLQFRSEESSPQ